MLTDAACSLLGTVIGLVLLGLIIRAVPSWPVIVIAAASVAVTRLGIGWLAGHRGRAR